MLLRSSSTPVLGSLISKSISVESPNSNYRCCQSEIPNPIPRHPSSPSVSKISSKQLSASQSFTNSLCNSSSSEFPGKSPARGGFRRAQSDGNLKGLDVIVGAPCDSIDELDFYNPSDNLGSRSRHSTLEAIPSFSPYDSRSRCEDENTEVDEDDFGCSEGCVMGDNLGFGEGREEMYLARGLGVCDGNFILRDCCNGGGDGDGDGDEGQGCIERHYLRLLEENPGNSLYLRNYASFLYQKKRNLESAENYYSRAILEDPKDGEVLSEYAHLIWDLYHDKDRATGYFELAVKTSSENSHVHAAFARFLWETEDEDEDEDSRVTSTVIREGIAA